MILSCPIITGRSHKPRKESKRKLPDQAPVAGLNIELV